MYIGMTSMTLKERLSAHRYQGSIFKHYRLAHCVKPTLDKLLENTSIIYRVKDRRRLNIFEALLIRIKKPILNENLTDFYCLKLFTRS